MDFMTVFKSKMRERGFTIIELLVVISVIGLISSIALANLQGAREKAKMAASKQFHSSVYRALGAETVAMWEFDEGAGEILNDNSGNGVNGRIYRPEWMPEGISGPALLFDGDTFVIGDNFPNPGNNGNLTASVWLRPTDIVGVHSVFYLGDNGAGGGSGSSCTGFEMFMNGGRYYSRSGDATNENEVQITSDTILANNVWQNVAYVYSGNKVTVYLNGQQVGQLNNHGTVDCPSGKWSIGAAITPDVSWPPIARNIKKQYKGYIDSLRIYNSALTSEEIRKVYAEDAKSRATLVSR